LDRFDLHDSEQFTFGSRHLLDHITLNIFQPGKHLNVEEAIDQEVAIVCVTVNFGCVAASPEDTNS